MNIITFEEQLQRMSTLSESACSMSEVLLKVNPPNVFLGDLDHKYQEIKVEKVLTGHMYLQEVGYGLTFFYCLPSLKSVLLI